MVSEKVKALLALSGKRQSDLATYFDMTSQSMHNKMSRDSWSGKDMAAVARFTGCKLAFVLPDGQMLTIEAEEDPDA
ncbi:MAG: helix-turn-helix domain containing protein [Clostridiales bacterium]|nr:helix-turn-helix domain containing protein [Clostridiales bacterium]